MSQHSPEPWTAENGVLVASDGWRIPPLGDDAMSDIDAERIVACLNACHGIPTHVLENWQGTDCAGFEPEDWLLNPVTEDGEGYLLVSPAGGVMRLSSEQRQRLGLALKTVQ